MAAGSGSQAAAGRGRGGLRASHADREQVIGTLKTAFVQGRLTGDELGERAGRVYASRTYAELDGVTADIPAEPAGARPRRDPWRATKIGLWIEYAVVVPGIFTLLALKNPHTSGLTVIVLPLVVYFVFWGLGGCVMASSRSTKRSAGQQPRDAQAAGLAGGGHQPVSFFDREQAARTLETALAQGRLTEDEHDARVPQVSTSRSGAELAALTDDLPAGLADRLPAARDMWTGVALIVAAISVLAAIVLLNPDNALAFLAALAAAATVLLAPGPTVGLMVDLVRQRRSARQDSR